MNAERKEQRRLAKIRVPLVPVMHPSSRKEGREYTGIPCISASILHDVVDPGGGDDLPSLACAAVCNDVLGRCTPTTRTLSGRVLQSSAEKLVVATDYTSHGEICWVRVWPCQEQGVSPGVRSPAPPELHPLAMPLPPEPTMRQERTVQATIFEVFAQHDIGCELKMMSPARARCRYSRDPDTFGPSQSARRIRRQPPVRNHLQLSALSNLHKTVCRQRRCRDKFPWTVQRSPLSRGFFLPRLSDAGLIPDRPLVLGPASETLQDY